MNKTLSIIVLLALACAPATDVDLDDIQLLVVAGNAQTGPAFEALISRPTLLDSFNVLIPLTANGNSVGPVTTVNIRLVPRLRRRFGPSQKMRPR